MEEEQVAMVAMSPQHGLCKFGHYPASDVRCSQKEEANIILEHADRKVEKWIPSRDMNSEMMVLC